MAKAKVRFPRREVAIRRVEWVVKPPQSESGTEDYDRYERDRLEVMRLIQAECGESQPHDLRVIEGPEETIISYQVQRVVLSYVHVVGPVRGGSREHDTALQVWHSPVLRRGVAVANGACPGGKG